VAGAGSLAVHLRHFVRAALAGLRASPLPAIVAVLTIATSLVLGGAFGLLVRSMQDVLARVGSEARVTAYLAADVDDVAARALAERARALDGVAAVERVSPARAAERFRAGSPERAALLDALGESPLTGSLEISLAPGRRDAAGVARLAHELAALPGVDDVSDAGDWVDGYGRTIVVLRAIGSGLALVLAAAALVLVASTIRLGLYARRNEIEILTLVGASRGFIATPFLLEGALEGLAGGLVAIGVLYALWRALLPALAGDLEPLLGGAPLRFFEPGEMALVVAVGAALGALGAALSVAGGLRR